MKKLKLIYFLLAICAFSSCLDEDPQYALNSESVFWIKIQHSWHYFPVMDN